MGGSPGNFEDPDGEEINQIIIRRKSETGFEEESFKLENDNIIYKGTKIISQKELAIKETVINLTQSSEDDISHWTNIAISSLNTALDIYKKALPKAKKMLQWYESEIKDGRTHYQTGNTTTFSTKVSTSAGYTIPLPLGLAYYDVDRYNTWLSGVYERHECFHIKQWGKIYQKSDDFLKAVKEWIEAEYSREIEAYEDTIKDLEERIELIEKMLKLLACPSKKEKGN